VSGLLRALLVVGIIATGVLVSAGLLVLRRSDRAIDSMYSHKTALLGRLSSKFGSKVVPYADVARQTRQTASVQIGILWLFVAAAVYAALTAN
jgi:hypothetical protein